MNEKQAQALINALCRQRDQAMNALAQAEAQIELQAGEIAALKAPAEAAQS